MKRRRSVFKFRSALRNLAPWSPPPAPWFRKPLSASASQSLAEAILWCSQGTLEITSNDPELLRNRRLISERKFEKANFATLSPLSQQLRSVALQPSADIGEAFNEIERDKAVTDLIRRRSQLLALEGPFDQEQIISRGEGRILIYEPAENVADGASQAGSLGFFDGNDASPWDTWFHYQEGHLACWVPESLITLAQQGIDANPVDCIHWADR